MKRTIIPLLLAVICIFNHAALAQTDDAIKPGDDIAITSTGQGKVKGYIHHGIFIFKGIPYAQSDRLTAPQKPKAWTVVRSSMSYGPVCPTNPATVVNDGAEFAFNHDLGYSNEHCQTLNVWTQKLNDGKKTPNC